MSQTTMNLSNRNRYMQEVDQEEDEKANITGIKRKKNR